MCLRKTAVIWGETDFFVMCLPFSITSELTEQFSWTLPLWYISNMPSVTVSQIPYKLLTWCRFCAGAQRDLTGCSAILTSALELNVSLKPEQQEKFLTLLLKSDGTNKQLLRTKQQYYCKPLKVPSFQLKFWIWKWSVTELRNEIYEYICHVVRYVNYIFTFILQHAVILKKFYFIENYGPVECEPMYGWYVPEVERNQPSPALALE
jgi:hypothetical protein